MSQLLERLRPRHPFARLDILSHLGETICLSPEPPPPLRREIPSHPVSPMPTRIIDEDPERWDGLS